MTHRWAKLWRNLLLHSMEKWKDLFKQTHFPQLLFFSSEPLILELIVRACVCMCVQYVCYDVCVCVCLYAMVCMRGVVLLGMVWYDSVCLVWCGVVWSHRCVCVVWCGLTWCVVVSLCNLLTSLLGSVFKTPLCSFTEINAMMWFYRGFCTLL